MKLPRLELWAELSPLLDELLDLSASAQQFRLAALRQQNPGLAEELAALLIEGRAAHSGGFSANALAHAHAGTGADVQTEASLAGQRLGSYVLEVPLGQGGGGSVWPALPVRWAKTCLAVTLAPSIWPRTEKNCSPKFGLKNLRPSMQRAHSPRCRRLRNPKADMSSKQSTALPQLARTPSLKPSIKPKARAVVVGPVIVDSGALLALFNRSDAWHEPVVGWLQRNSQVQLVTTWPVCTEVCALLARRIANAAALDLLRWAMRGGVAIDPPDGNTLAEVLSISERFLDLPFDLADASVAEAAARMKVRSVLTIDSDFDVYRDKAGKPLVNVLR